MSEVRRFDRDDDEEVSENNSYNKKIKMHRQRVKAVVLIVLIVAAVAGVVFYVIRSHVVLTTYVVEASVDRNDGQYAEYKRFGDSFLKYGYDGISMYDSDGIQLWNQSYEMSNPAIDICGDYVAVADIGGTNVYVCSKSGGCYKFNTAINISSISVTGSGLTVAILQDGDVSYINMYDQSGEKIYSIKSLLTGDGMPVSASVSEDGEKLIVAYTMVDTMEMKTSIVFYNFGEVGQNETERIVGGFDTYGSQLVSFTRFFGSKKAVALGEKTLSFFAMTEYPSLKNDIAINYEIRKIFYSDDYFALVSSGENGTYKVNVYDFSGNLVLDTEVDDKFTSFSFCADGILMNNDYECLIMDMKGNSVFSYTFDTEIRYLFGISDREEFIYMTSYKIYKIRLK